MQPGSTSPAGRQNPPTTTARHTHLDETIGARSVSSSSQKVRLEWSAYGLIFAKFEYRHHPVSCLTTCPPVPMPVPLRVRLQRRSMRAVGSPHPAALFHIQSNRTRLRVHEVVYKGLTTMRRTRLFLVSIALGRCGLSESLEWVVSQDFGSIRPFSPICRVHP